jgi:carbohydrate-selective porin OprB
VRFLLALFAALALSVSAAAAAPADVPCRWCAGDAADAVPEMAASFYSDGVYTQDEVRAMLDEAARRSR